MMATCMQRYKLLDGSLGTGHGTAKHSNEDFTDLIPIQPSEMCFHISLGSLTF